MADIDNNNNNNNNDNNTNNGDNVGGMPHHKNPRCMVHKARTQRNVHKTEMKTRLLQILYPYHFAGLDTEDPYTRLTKFYEIFGTLGVT